MKINKIAIIGRTEILYETALLLLDRGYKIPLIITGKEAPEYQKTAEDFKELASKIGAKFIYTNKINNKLEELKSITSVNPIDIGISLNYPTIISQEVINLFKLGILNAHGGDLPRYRGNACQGWAILQGEQKIGICVHKMEGGKIDSGPILAKDYLPININTKITHVIEYLRKNIPKLFLQVLSKLQENPNYVLEYQDESKALRTYPLMPEDARINWLESNEKIVRLINAFNKPYNGAFCFYKEQKLTIWDAEIYKDNEKYLAIPGQVAEILPTKEIIVTTGNGKIKINEIQFGDYIGKPGNIIKSIRNRLK